MNGFINWLLGLFGSSPTPAPDPTDPCNAAACVNAKQRLATARSKFNSICNGLKTLKVIGDALKQIVSTPIWILVALLIVAALGALIGGIFGMLISLFAVVLLAIWAISFLLLPVVGKMGQALAQELVKQQTEITAALQQVVANCPERCRGDVSIPQCNVG